MLDNIRVMSDSRLAPFSLQCHRIRVCSRTKQNNRVWGEHSVAILVQVFTSVAQVQQLAVICLFVVRCMVPVGRIQMPLAARGG